MSIFSVPLCQMLVEAPLRSFVVDEDLLERICVLCFGCCFQRIHIDPIHIGKSSLNDRKAISNGGFEDISAIPKVDRNLRGDRFLSGETPFSSCLVISHFIPRRNPLKIYSTVSLYIPLYFRPGSFNHSTSSIRWFDILAHHQSVLFVRITKSKKVGFFFDLIEFKRIRSKRQESSGLILILSSRRLLLRTEQEI